MNGEKRGRDTFAKYKWVIMFLARLCSKIPMRLRLWLFETHRYTKGKLGLGLRYAFLKSVAVECGDNVAVYPGVYILNVKNLSLGSNISIQPMAYIECGNVAGGVRIDDDVSIAHGVTIMATTHLYDGKESCIKDQGVLTRTTHISKNVWIGAKATILAGVTVASGCVIGANAVVTGNTDVNKVYAGVPAKVIKER